MGEEGPSSAWRAQKRYGKRPAMMEIPEHMAQAPPAPGRLPLLLYNICAIMCVHVLAFWCPVTHTGLGSRMPTSRDTSRLLRWQHWTRPNEKKPDE